MGCCQSIEQQLEQEQPVINSKKKIEKSKQSHSIKSNDLRLLLQKCHPNKNDLASSSWPKLPNPLVQPSVRIDYRKLKAKIEQEEIFRKAAAKIGHLSKLNHELDNELDNEDIKIKVSPKKQIKENQAKSNQSKVSSSFSSTMFSNSVSSKPSCSTLLSTSSSSTIGSSRTSFPESDMNEFYKSSGISDDIKN